VSLDPLFPPLCFSRYCCFFFFFFILAILCVCVECFVSKVPQDSLLWEFPFFFFSFLTFFLVLLLLFSLVGVTGGFLFVVLLCCSPFFSSCVRSLFFSPLQVIHCGHPPPPLFPLAVLAVVSFLGLSGVRRDPPTLSVFFPGFFLYAFFLLFICWFFRRDISVSPPPAFPLNGYSVLLFALPNRKMPPFPLLFFPRLLFSGRLFFFAVLSLALFS